MQREDIMVDKVLALRIMGFRFNVMFRSKAASGMGSTSLDAVLLCLPVPAGN